MQNAGGVNECRRSRTGIDGRKWRTVAAVAALGLIAAACSSASHSSTAGSAKAAGTGTGTGTLTVAFPAAPTTLDPTKANQSSATFLQLAYDSFVRLDANGAFSPDLATSWGYVGSGNKTFDMTLRSGVRYSDGSPVTTASVVAYLDYLRSSQAAPFLSGATIDQIGTDKVEIKMTAPYPSIPFQFSQYNVIGDPIGPTGMANQSALGHSTDGAGEYTLDTASTVANSQYVYTPNPYYWNKAAVHYGKVVIRIIATPQSEIDALKTGQANVALVGPDLSVAPAAKAAGLQLIGSPSIFEGLLLADRSGQMSKPLGDVRVRQALNYAVNRSAITAALTAGYGTPTDETVPVGADGDSTALHNYYPYDPAKAKQLLAQAGYPNGFQLDVASEAGVATVLQAIAGQLAAVGVKLNVVNLAYNVYATDVLEAKYPAAGVALGAGPMTFEYTFLFAPTAPFNPFHTTDTTLTSLTNQMLTASQSALPGIDQKIENYLVANAWLVPVSFVPIMYYAQQSVGGIAVTPSAPLPTITDWYQK